MTLTYNLYHCDQLNPVPSLNVTTTPFYQNLKAALGQPHFLCEGGVLGFACQHTYVFENFEKSKDPKVLLKGSDRMVMLAATSLELIVDVKSIVKTEKVEITWECVLNALNKQQILDEKPFFLEVATPEAYLGYSSELQREFAEQIGLTGWQDNILEEIRRLFLRSYGDSLFHCGFYYEVTHDVIDKENGYSWKQYFKDCRYESAEDIIWCQILEANIPAITATTYGNDPSAETCYMAAAILVNVPKWSER